MEHKTSLEVTLKGVSDYSGKLESIDERYDQASAVVVVTYKQHNDHMTIQRGMIIGDFNEKYYTTFLRELMNSWGLWKVIKATVRAALKLLPYNHVP